MSNCSSDLGVFSDTPDAFQVKAPQAPDVNDARFDIASPTYSIIGNEFTPDQKDILIEVQGPNDVAEIQAWVADTSFDLPSTDPGVFSGPITLGPEVGTQKVLLAQPDEEQAFAVIEIIRTHPLYVLVTDDWDDAYVTLDQFDLQADLEANHSDVRFTHLVGPDLFTASHADEDESYEIQDSDRQSHISWLSRSQSLGHEVGLHIHPWCSFVETAGINCRTDNSYFYENPDINQNGKTTILESYTQAELETMIAKADELFIENNLGKPVSFRAGGWTGGIKTLTALQNQGYLVDSSAVNWGRSVGKTSSFWIDLLMQTWNAIADISQPYFPGLMLIDTQSEPSLELLQLPNNANFVEYVDTAEMIDIFKQHWQPGQTIDVPKAYTVGYHMTPYPTQENGYIDRLDGLLDHTDQFQSQHDGGPVIYATMKDMVKVWQKK